MIDLKYIDDPKKNSWILKILRAIYKILRVFYVCWNYYFTPLIAVYITVLYAPLPELPDDLAATPTHPIIEQDNANATSILSSIGL